MNEDQAEHFLKIIERVIRAVIRDAQSRDVEDAVNLSNVKREATLELSELFNQIKKQ